MGDSVTRINQTYRILILDDEEQMCISLKSLLEKEGYTTDYSISARNAMPLLIAKNYSLIICDIRMPEMSGLSFLSKIGHKTPIIMITAYASIETARSAFQARSSRLY